MYKNGVALQWQCSKNASNHLLLHLLVVQGAYCLTLEFESKLELSIWEDRQPKIQSFFGPGG